MDESLRLRGEWIPSSCRPPSVAARRNLSVVGRCRVPDAAVAFYCTALPDRAAMISIPSFSGLSRVSVNANQSGLPSLCVPCLLLLLHPRAFFRLIFVSSSVLFTTSPLVTNFPLQTNSNSLVSVMFPGGGKRRISSGAMQCTDYHPRSVSGGFRLKKKFFKVQHRRRPHI